MYRACIIGDKNSVYGFAAAGIEVIDANAQNFEQQILEAYNSKKYGVIFVTDALFGLVPKKLGQGGGLPVITPVSGFGGSGQYGRERLKQMIKTATGSLAVFDSLEKESK